MFLKTKYHNNNLTNGKFNENLRTTTILKELESAYYQDPKRFIPVTLNDIKSKPSSRIELYVKTLVDNKAKYILYYKGNDIFRDGKREDSIKRNIHRLFKPKTGNPHYLQYIESNLREILLDEMEDENVKSKIIYDVGLDIVQDIFANDIVEYKTISRAKDWVFRVADFILEDQTAFSNLGYLIQNDRSMSKHCLNTAIMGLLFGKFTGLNAESLNDLGIGLLFHDIGLNKIKKMDYTYGRDFTRYDIICQHPIFGLSMLKNTKRFSIETLELIREHHECIDGTGYPYKLKGSEISNLAKYAKIIDEYDLLLNREKNKHSEKPHYIVLNKMVTQLKSKLDINLLHNFIKFVSASHKKNKNTNSNYWPIFHDNNSKESLALDYSN